MDSENAQTELLDSIQFCYGWSKAHDNNFFKATQQLLLQYYIIILTTVTCKNFNN